MKKYILHLSIISISFLSGKVIAQANYLNVSGVIKEKKNSQAIPFATVSLYLSKDSTLSKGTIADAEGKFVFDNIPTDKYYITAQSIGFKKLTLAVPEDKMTVFIPFDLDDDATLLNEVKVVGNKAIIEKKFDRIIFNVENSPLASGSNVLEALGRTPGVIVNQDDKIKLKGRTDILIMVDNKPVQLSGEGLSSFLKGMASEGIVSIEVINSSAKYDASVSGVLNIKTKKGQVNGFNGNTALSYGRSPLEKVSGNFNMYYKAGKWNFLTYYSRQDNRSRFNSASERRFVNGDKRSFQDVSQARDSHTQPNDIRLGVDYNLHKNHVVGVLFDANINTPSSNRNFLINFKNPFGTIDSTQSTLATTDDKTNFKNFNFNYKGKLDSLGRSINVDVDYATDDYNSLRNFDANLLRQGVFVRNIEKIRTNANYATEIRSFKTDYTHPLNSKTTIETGFKISDVAIKNMMIFEDNIDTRWIKNDLFSDRTNYQEGIKAAYLSANTALKDYQIRFGLRVENTSSEIKSLDKNTAVTRNYTNWFPSFAIERSLKNDNSIAFRAKRNISRPSYSDLNPFIFYQNKYNYFQGNPYLLPNITSSVELEFSLGGNLITTLYFNHSKNSLYESFEQNNQTLTTRNFYANIDKVQTYGISVSYNKQFFKWWNFQTEMYVDKSHFADSKLWGTGFKTEGQSSYIGIQQSFTLPNNFRINTGGFFISPQKYVVGYQQSNYSTDISVIKTFLEKRCSAKLSFNDIFWTQRFNSTTDISNQYERFRSFRDTRLVRLTVSYKFKSKTDVKQRSRDVGSSSEQDRIKHN